MFGIDSSDDIGFCFNGRKVSLQQQIKRQRLSEVLIAFSLVLSTLSILLYFLT
jgi:hypothetical protein